LQEPKVTQISGKIRLINTKNQLLKNPILTQEPTARICLVKLGNILYIVINKNS